MGHQIYLSIIIILTIIIIGISLYAFKTLKSIRSSVPRPKLLRKLSRNELLKQRSYDEYVQEFNFLVTRVFELGEFSINVIKNDDMQKACSIAINGGKRLRPIILMEMARATAQQTSIVVDPAEMALSIEYIHAASLVVDDLPEFDNDKERRGAPSLWAATSPSTAKMAVVTMVSGAFQNTCRQIDWIRDNCPRWVNPDRLGTLLCSQLSIALGSMGAAGGQYMDTLNEKQLALYGTDVVKEIIQKKTSPFFEIAFVCGWLIGGGSPDNINEIRFAGRKFGTAFQIADDLGDMEQDARRQKEGKPGWNYANVYGYDAAEREACQCLIICRRILEFHKIFTPLWEEIYNSVWKMAD
jgi:geranylgeranyl diphosphate synthase type II